ncbi:MAG: LPP20 family lipoprotein [Campylobacterota bacterium]|nr:LPP20 family lipoprotein [Campylobacterota bacterium]
MIQKIVYSVALCATLFATPPSWYVENSLPSKSYEVVGYGEGKTKAQAKKRAKADISKTVQSTIQTLTKMNESEIDGEYKQSTKIETKESSNIVLEGVEFLKSTYRDGKYFIALKYINLPFAQKVRLKFSSVESIAKEKNSYLLQTPLLKELESEFGFFPQVKIVKNKLIIENRSFTIDKENLKKLFVSIENRFLKIQQPDAISAGNYYFIDIKTQKSGYVTVVQLYENGELSLLYSNKKMDKNRRYSYPNSDEYDGIEAYLNEGIVKTKDLTIAVLCEDKKDFSYFDTISEEKESFAKVYGTFFGMIDRCSVSSKSIVIKR